MRNPPDLEIARPPAIPRAVLVTTLFLCAALSGHGQSGPKLEADRIVVEKSAHTMTLLRQGKVLKTYKVALSTVPVGAKEHTGDHKVPEGLYKIDVKRIRTASFTWRCIFPTQTPRTVSGRANWGSIRGATLKFTD
jgi:L,D-transpeptidase-like protein